MSSTVLEIIIFLVGCIIGTSVRPFYKLCCVRENDDDEDDENSFLEDQQLYRFSLREAMRRSIENENNIGQAEVIEQPREVTTCNNYITAEAKYISSNVIVLDEENI